MIMSDSEKDVLVLKELKVIEAYLENMRRTPSWRLPTICALARDSRGGLLKTQALIGYTGQWWRDVGLYAASCLPLMIPVNLAIIATAFTALVALVSSTLSVVTMEPKIIETTVEVPFWFFFTTTKVVTETVMVPVVHAPDPAVSRGGAVLIILTMLLCISWTLKRLWLREIDLRKRRLEQLWASIRVETSA